MRMSHTPRSVINLLRQPFTQRLITLAISALLAVSLTCMPIVLALHTSEHKTAFHPSRAIFASSLRPGYSYVELSYEVSFEGRRAA